MSDLIVHLDDVPETILVPAKHLSGGSVGARIAYGLDASMMVATRQPGYHSKPHRHAAEQLNYVMEGELYVFVDDGGFLARKGDLFRIPSDAVHWSWVQGTTACVLLEVHAPALLGDPGVIETAAALLGPGEIFPAGSGVQSRWPANVDQGTVERAVTGDAA
jgi:quercetin dioxygenase-like cupin family protein